MKLNPLALQASIVAAAKYLPPLKVTADEIDNRIDKPSGWTASKTGVLERRYADGQLQSALAANAAKAALESANLQLGDIDLLLSASGVPEQPIPSNAARFLAALAPDHRGIACYDLNATCLSFPVALEHAALSLTHQRYKRVLIIASEIASKGLDYSEPESAALMGDGAAAVIVERAEVPKRFASSFQTFPEGIALAEIRAGGTRLHFSDQPSTRDSLFHMDGKALFRLVSKDLTRIVNQALDRANLQLSDIDLVIPHHASFPAIELLRNRLHISPDQLYQNLATHGNTIAASIPMALSDCIESGRLNRGQNVMLVGTSAGVSIGVTIFEY